MPENKRQHYVPQFYLRNFAGPGGGTLGVFNLKTDRFITPAKLKSQAAKSWLYGADGEAERHFSSIEGAAAKSIRRILTTGRPPRRWQEDHYRLITFAMLQWARTPAAEQLANKQVDAITKSLLRQQEAPQEILNNLNLVKISDGNAMQNAITMALLGAPAVYDLAFKLIDNTKSEVAPFVTSDHPVSLHNRLFEGSGDLPVTGTGASGLQMWLALSPRYGLMFYDRDAYRLGRPDSRIVRVVSPTHVAQLNALTWWGASENVYASPNTDPGYLRAAAEAIAPLRRETRIWIEEDVLERTETTKRVRVAFKVSGSPIRLDLPFLRTVATPPNLAGLEEVPMRQPERIADLMEWGRLYRKGLIDFDTIQWLCQRVPRQPRRPEAPP